MDALDAILSKPPQYRDAIENMLLQHDYPDEARKAAEKYASYQAIATAAREVVRATNYDQERRRNIPEAIRKRIDTLAAALAALQETK